MNDNQTKKLIKLESLDNIQIEDKQQELSLEEVYLIQGGRCGTTPITISPIEQLQEIFGNPRIPKCPPMPCGYNPFIPKDPRGNTPIIFCDPRITPVIL